MHPDISGAAAVATRFSRRSCLVGAAGAALATAVGCSSAPEPAAAPAPEVSSGTRVVTHALGEATIPLDPQRLVALDELAALAALASGRRPVTVFTSTGDAPAAAILTAQGIELRPAGLGELPPIEALAAIGPDLIVGTGAEAAVGVGYDRLTPVAPTIVLDISGDWEQLITAAAEAFGDADAGRRQIAAVTGRLTAAAQAPGSGRELSLLGYSTQPFSMPPHAPVSTLIAAAGFTRPASQQGETDGYSIPLSPEQLSSHDGDLLVVPTGAYYSAQTLFDLPTAATLRGERIVPVAEQWFGTTAFAFFVVATDLLTVATGEGEVLTADRLTAVWDEFVGETAA